MNYVNILIVRIYIMASTRNKNTPGDYALEKHSINKQFDERMYIHQSQGQAKQINLPGNGLLTGRFAARDLAKNGCDIESYLFGIGSTNLETPLAPVKPELNTIKSINVMEKTPMIMPKPFSMEPNQRPMYLN
jgi:hypothetical protein